MKRFFMLVFLLPALLALPGCVTTSPPTRHYMVTPMVAEPLDTRLAVEIGVEPVVVPSYLNRAEIIQRAGINELRLAAYHHWVEKLSDNLTRVIAENMTVLLPNGTAYTLPTARRTHLDYKLFVEIFAFEQLPDGVVTLKGRWKLVSAANGALVSTNAFTLNSQAVEETDYPAIVQQMSTVLAEMCREVARAIGNHLPLKG